jgi:hypothetical protein
MYALGTLAGIYGLLLVAALVSFPLDALQMRRRVADAAQSKFTLMSATAVLRLGLYALGAIVLSLSLFRSARLVVTDDSRDDPSSGLVMRNLSGRLRPTPGTLPAVPTGDEYSQSESTPAV